jgi:ABC-type multidrug transport system ATPase subunit/peptidoglycan/LPS O-acetylase OafA/YrhL
VTHSPRLHALDATRAVALLLGVVLHATMSFFLPLPATDASPSVALGVTFYTIHMFRMTLFFVIAGFFAHLAYHRHGPRAFLRDRAKRIVVPMTIGWVVLAPLTIGMVIWGVSRSLAGTPGAAAPAPAPDGFPLIHLWFLYYLCLCYAVVLVARWGIVTVAGTDGALHRVVDTAMSVAIRQSLAPVLLAAPLCAVFVLQPVWAAWFGITTPDSGLMPQVPALTGFVTAFVFGWLLHRQRALLPVIEARWALHLALAIGLTITSLAMVGLSPTTTVNPFEGAGAREVLYAAAYTLAIWCWAFGLLGAALRFFNRANPVWRYLADASYWIYLAHMPVVFGLQVSMMRWPLHWAVKFPLIILITLGVLLATYHLLVRSTVIGEVLNGRRQRDGDIVPVGAREHATAVVAVHDSPDAEVSRTQLASLTRVTKRYGSPVALADVSLAVTAGEVLALLGPNGAGKTTTLGLWLGTLEADSGQVQLMGGSPFEVQHRLDIGAMMQEVTLAAPLTAREHIALTASYYRDPMPVDEAVALAGIATIADTRVGKLSTGQKRQVQFALAVVGRPRLLFLDEPTVGLDVEARETMWRTIRGLLAGGCSVVLTTHYLEEAEALADRVVVLAKGKVIAEGSVDEMRALVTRKRISCRSAIDAADIRGWPGVIEAERDTRLLHVTAMDAELVVRRLLASDPALSQLEVKQATLAEAFQALTQEAA